MGSNIFSKHIVDEAGNHRLKEWVTRRVKNNEHFIRTYLSDLGLLYRCTGKEQSVLLACLQYVDYNTNELILSPLRRKEICAIVGSTRGTVNVMFSRLFEKGLLVKKEDGKLLLNPKLFFYGNDIERDKVLQVYIKYELIVPKKGIPQPSKDFSNE